MSAEDVAVTILVGLVALIPIMIIANVVNSGTYQTDAERLIPKDWKPDFNFSTMPKMVINSATREIAFIDRKHATIVSFSDIKTWQHLWTNNTRVNPGIFVNTAVNSTSDHRVKIVASGMPTPSIIVHGRQAAEICDALELYLT